MPTKFCLIKIAISIALYTFNSYGSFLSKDNHYKLSQYINAKNTDLTQLENVDNNILNNAALYSQYSKIIYQVDFGSIKAWSCESCSELNKLTNIKYFRDEVLDAVGILGVNKSKKSIVLVFRGTWSMENWFLNFNIEFSNFTKNNELNKSLGRIHKGVFMYTNSLFDKYQDDLVELISQYPDFEIVTTGHSLGGEVAVASAAKIQLEMNIVPITYGLAYPHFGDEQFAKWAENNMNIVKILNKNDCVGKISFFGRFKPVGKPKIIATKDKKAFLCNEQSAFDDTEIYDECTNDKGNDLDFFHCIFEEQMENHGFYL